MFGWGFKCKKCHLPLSIYFARHYVKQAGNWWDLIARGDSAIKVKCPKHGKFSAKFNNNLRELWMDQFTKAMLRCMKCEKIGTPENIKTTGGAVTFQIKCPDHGLSDEKKVTSSLFNIAIELYEKGISYQDWDQHSKKYTICGKCGHMVEPEKYVCDKCGADLTSIDLDW